MKCIDWKVFRGHRNFKKRPNEHSHFLYFLMPSLRWLGTFMVRKQYIRNRISTTVASTWTPKSRKVIQKLKSRHVVVPGISIEALSCSSAPWKIYVKIPSLIVLHRYLGKVHWDVYQVFSHVFESHKSNTSRFGSCYCPGIE